MRKLLIVSPRIPVITTVCFIVRATCFGTEDSQTPQTPVDLPDSLLSDSQQQKRSSLIEKAPLPLKYITEKYDNIFSIPTPSSERATP